MAVTSSSSLNRIALNSILEISALQIEHYVFVLTEPTTVKLYSRGYADSAVSIVDSDENLVLENDDFNGQKNFYLEKSLLPGTYIVEPSFNNNAADMFTFYLETVNPENISTSVAIADNVTKLYVATFNRAPDAAGLKYWVEDSGLTLTEVASSFFDQPETQDKYPTDSSNISFVTEIYHNLFNREPDAAGLTYWVDELNRFDESAGREGVPRSKMILAVINGAQNTPEYGNDATILTNKTIVSSYFVNAGLNNLDDAKRIMEHITDDIQSVYDALNSYDID